MKLEVGMYVRTHKGEIKKIFQYNEQENNPLFCVLNCYVTNKGTILKASHNIIDLIEVGDYVNGEKVTSTMIKMRDEQGVFGLPNYYRTFVEEIPIKSIVTKEQFEVIKYEVK